MLTLRSPAKVNLFLRILQRRPDGYHELASLFQAIDLCDLIHFELAENDQLSCTDPALPTDGSNLIFKAIQLFRHKTNLSFGIKVHLDKRIPYQAGLGGGSSNAATTLWALNQLCGCPATLAELRSWSGEIGSDITFFLSQGTAYCTGRGEIIRDLAPLQKASLWIVKPDEGLSTPHVYKSLNLSTLPPRDPELFLRRFLSNDPDYFNDLEEAAFKVMPALREMKSTLLAGCRVVLLCGSGSSFFCMEGERPSFQRGAQIYSARFINRSIHDWYRCGLGD